MPSEFPPQVYSSHRSRHGRVTQRAPTEIGSSIWYPGRLVSLRADLRRLDISERARAENPQKMTSVVDDVSIPLSVVELSFSLCSF